MLDKTCIGSKLRKLRQEAGLSLLEASEKVGITISALAMYERGERLPRDEVKVRLAQFYNHTVGEIFFGESKH